MPEEKPYLTGRTYIFKLNKGDDLLNELQEFCRDNQIKCGIIKGIGAVSCATLGFFDQKKKKYNKVKHDRAFEILSLLGNISLMEEKPMVHLHASMCDDQGGLVGGHLMGGTTVFACEIFVQELVGAPKMRKLDKVTGITIWADCKE
ncbi:MAG: DNA-binding protein [Elusimicrobia bacterium]|nr:DNA-binding protein [Elusimicrobiota bacterium]